MQAVMRINEGSLAAQMPQTQLKLRKICQGHLLAAARLASFAAQGEVL